MAIKIKYILVPKEKIKYIRFFLFASVDHFYSFLQAKSRLQSRVSKKKRRL